MYWLLAKNEEHKKNKILLLVILFIVTNIQAQLVRKEADLARPSNIPYKQNSGDHRMEKKRVLPWVFLICNWDVIRQLNK